MRISLRAGGAGLIAAVVLAVSSWVGAPASAVTTRPGLMTAVSQLGEWGGLDGVYRIAYTTTDAGGAVVRASGIVRLPSGPRPDGGWPIVSWAHGTSGLGQNCGLTDSADLIRGTAPTIDDLNRAGYAVVATDYIGLSPKSPGPHPYLQTRSEATAVIDIVRAARSLFVGLSDTWAVGGSSQGGQAALGAGHLAERYAPDLDFRGTVALAPASNFEDIVPMLRPGMRLPKVTAGSLAAILAGMSAHQHDVDIESYLSPLGKRVVAEVRTACGPEWEGILNGARPGDLLSKPLGDNAFRSAIRNYMAIPTKDYTQPILVVQGFRDTTVPLPLTLALLAGFRSAGTAYDLATINAGHSDLREHGGVKKAIEFLDEVMSKR